MLWKPARTCSKTPKSGATDEESTTFDAVSITSRMVGRPRSSTSTVTILAEIAARSTTSSYVSVPCGRSSQHGFNEAGFSISSSSELGLERPALAIRCRSSIACLRFSKRLLLTSPKRYRILILRGLQEPALCFVAPRKPNCMYPRTTKEELTLTLLGEAGEAFLLVRTARTGRCNLLSGDRAVNVGPYRRCGTLEVLGKFRGNNPCDVRSWGGRTARTGRSPQRAALASGVGRIPNHARRCDDCRRAGPILTQLLARSSSVLGAPGSCWPGRSLSSGERCP
jgi:hypothetical protein